MKKILLVLMLMIPVLSGCLIIPIDPSFEVVSASSRTNYVLTQNGEQSFAICNDRTTELEYEFKYTGTLIAWESYLRGDQGGIAGRTEFTPDDSRAAVDTVNKTVKVIYQINPGGAPKLAALFVDMPNITINPKAVISGYSTLFLTAEGFLNSEPLNSKKMAVIDNCNDFID